MLHTSCNSIRRMGPLFTGALLASCFLNPPFAQNIGWEGETGIFVTPLAYTAASPAAGFGLPIVAYHF
jgi:hypothetical protein